MVTQKAARSFPKLTLGLLGLIGVLCGSGCDVSNNGGKPAVQTADPVVVDYPVAYVRRPMPLDKNRKPVPAEVLDPKAFNPGAKLIVKERASATARERILTDVLFKPGTDGKPALYDVKDLSVSPDGHKLVFALRAPEIPNADDDEQPTWNIWEYDTDATPDSSKLHRVIVSDLQAERGDDVAPHYLPDGKIVFSSNRQSRTRAILTDELKPQYSGLDDKRQDEAFMLHVMDNDGENIEQVSYNVSSDLQPTVLDSGNLLFLRRDGINSHNQISLYTSKPDGSDVQPYYGFFSQMTGTNNTEATFVRPQPLPDGRILAILQPRSTELLGGDIIAIDASTINTQNMNTQTTLSPNPVDTTGATAALGGLYSSAFPMYDGTDRLIVSWSPCRLVNTTTMQIRPCSGDFNKEGLEPADPLYGLWIYNTKDGTHSPIQIPEEGFMFTEPVVMAPNIKAPFWQPENLDPKLVEQNVGLVHIRSVYDVDGVDLTPRGINAVADPVQTATANRPVRFLRIVKNVPIPDDDVLDFDNSIFGRSTAQGMRDIVGYVPVEPDGSALFKVPADIPVMFDLLDANGKRVTTRHENWLYLRPGETRECTGCHAAASTAPHGRRDLEKPSVNLGAISGAPFANSRLLDKFGTPQPLPVGGESMAQYYARVNGPRTPSADIIFNDEWTNPASGALLGPDISLRYVDINTRANANPSDHKCAPLANAPMTWVAPTHCVDAGSWTSICRTTINYLDSVAPLWQADRRSCDDAGAVTADNTCTSCHTRTINDMTQVPAGQLELTSEISQDHNDYITSYAELMFNDDEQEVVEGSLTDKKVLTNPPTFEVDPATGNLRLDGNGQPIPVTVTVPVAAIMSTGGARSSNRFFNLFPREDADPTTFSMAQRIHFRLLSRAELKLIAEWLDIGGQYYNNPFDAPVN